MAEVSLTTARPQTGLRDAPPEVRLEIRQGAAQAAVYPVGDGGFLIGAVPGCDLRLSGVDLPPVLCLVARQPGGVFLRKLAATHPLLVNGKPVSGTALADGDTITAGPAQFTVRIEAPAPALRAPHFQPAPAQPFTSEREELHQRLLLFRGEVARFKEQSERIEEEQEKRRLELDQREEQAAARLRAAEQRAAEVPAPVRDLEQREQALAERAREVEKRASELEAQRQEVATARQELADIRTQLYDRYRERRDRLAGLQDAVNRAARKVQERKQQLDEDVRQAQARRQEDEGRRAELDAQKEEAARARAQLEEERALVARRREEIHADVAERLAEGRAREEKVDAERAALERDQAQYREDLVRLDRLRDALDQREKEVGQHLKEHESRLEQLQRDTRDLEEQVLQLDEWHTKLCAVGERLAKQKSEQDALAHQLAARAAALEGQQATLAALRTRLERIREEAHKEGQELVEQRARQGAIEAELQQRLQEAQQLRVEVDAEKTLLEQERRQFTERSAVLEGAVAQLRQAQERLTKQEEELRERSVVLDADGARQAEQTSLTQARMQQLDDLQKRLDAERDALRERTLLLAQAEQARESLQEQLRRRSEELSVRQKSMAEQVTQYETAAREVAARRAALEQERQRGEEGLAGLRADLERRAAEAERLQAELTRREDNLRRQQEILKIAGRTVAEERKVLAEERVGAEEARRAGEEAAAQHAAEFETVRREAQTLQQQLPELELRAGTALERLTHARELLREHLGEVHTFARQCEEDLDGLKGQLQAAAERLQQQEAQLRRGQDEQRLAMAAFRQQLLDWQGQVAELKRLLAQGETRLQRQRAQVDEQARQVEADSQRLARQAEQLQVEERAVAERRGEVDRHLDDMREWYCRKLRELAGVREPAGEEDVPPPATGPGRDILSLTGDVDPADRKLGDLLRSLGLVEPDTLTALLVEARRQRRSLRQVLLAGGVVTLYQMALIEAGNLDALVLGRLRVIDRLRATVHETVYRIFDPGRGHEAVLRHLSEAEAGDAVRPDEFRQRFGQAVLDHPNVAGTLELLEIAGRPAALQEWLTGLASSEWPALVAVPGVWFRLLLQAAQGLEAAHQVGLVHGHLRPELLLLTGDGIVKLCGFGEPHWLAVPPFAESDDSAADLCTLGQIAAGWGSAGGRRKPGKGKGLPDGLQAVLDRLGAETAEARFRSASELLDELDRVRGEVPANPEAWDRLLRQAREEATPQALFRQTA